MTQEHLADVKGRTRAWGLGREYDSDMTLRETLETQQQHLAADLISPSGIPKSVRRIRQQHK
jgi:hypothetical protein